MVNDGIGFKPGIRHRRKLLLVVALAGAAWATLISLIFIFNTGNYTFWFPGRVLTYVLLIVAPALTFIPVGRAIGAPLYGYWAVLSWAIFGYLLAFVQANPQTGWQGNTGPLVALFVALFMITVTITLPIFYRLGFKVFKQKVAQYDLSRAVREGVLAGLWVALSAFLRVAVNLNLLVVLFLLAVALVVLELLILSSNAGRR